MVSTLPADPAGFDLEFCLKEDQGVPRGVKGEKRHPKDVYAKTIPHSAHGGVGGDSAPSVRPWWLWDGGGGLIRL